MNPTHLVTQSDTPAGRAFETAILGLIVYSMITFPLETLPDLSPGAERFFHVSEMVVTVLFTCEYVLRLCAADRPLRYATSFFGLVDLVAIAPYLLGGALDLRALRAVRLFRIVRLFKLTRYSRAMRRFARALSLAREEIVLFMCAAGLLIYLAAVGIWFFEHEAQPDKFQSVVHSMWWAVATLTTVGYGDVYPITSGGKIFTFLVLAVGLGIVAVPTGLIASALTKVREEEVGE